MLKVQEIRELIKAIDHSSIEEFSFEHEGSKIKIKKNLGNDGTNALHNIQQPTVAVVANQVDTKQPTDRVVMNVPVSEPIIAETVSEVETNLHKITSPMVGTFYHSQSPDMDSYVKVGSKVSNDSIVCIVEAMKLFNEIEAEVSGEIIEILVKNGQLVEFGQPLFLVKPE